MYECAICTPESSKFPSEDVPAILERFDTDDASPERGKEQIKRIIIGLVTLARVVHCRNKCSKKERKEKKRF